MDSIFLLSHRRSLSIYIVRCSSTILVCGWPAFIFCTSFVQHVHACIEKVYFTSLRVEVESCCRVEYHITYRRCQTLTLPYHIVALMCCVLSTTSIVDVPYIYLYRRCYQMTHCRPRSSVVDLVRFWFCSSIYPFVHLFIVIFWDFVDLLSTRFQFHLTCALSIFCRPDVPTPDIAVAFDWSLSMPVELPATTFCRCPSFASPSFVHLAGSTPQFLLHHHILHFAFASSSSFCRCQFCRSSSFI